MALASEVDVTGTTDADGFGQSLAGCEIEMTSPSPRATPNTVDNKKQTRKISRELMTVT